MKLAEAGVAEKQANVQLKQVDIQAKGQKAQADLQIGLAKVQGEQAKSGLAQVRMQGEAQKHQIEGARLQLEAAGLEETKRQHDNEMMLAQADLAGKHALQKEAQDNEDDRERIAMELGRADVEKDFALAEHKETQANRREAAKLETQKEVADDNNKTSLEIARIGAKAKAKTAAQTTNRKK